MPSYHDLPNKEQIAAINDVGALEDIRDEVDRAIARIETDLEFSDRDDDWYFRARNSLALHKYIGTMLDRRIRELRPKPKAAPNPMAALAGAKTSARKRTACSAFTLAAFDGQIIDPESVPDELSALETAMATVKKQIDALKDDRDDELLNFEQAVRDQDFLMRVSVATRHCGAAHQALLKRAAKIRQAEKAKVQAARDLARPQAFVEAAREVLDRETFLAIWEVVDRREPLTQAHAA